MGKSQRRREGKEEAEGWVGRAGQGIFWAARTLHHPRVRQSSHESTRGEGRNVAGHWGLGFPGSLAVVASLQILGAEGGGPQALPSLGLLLLHPWGPGTQSLRRPVQFCWNLQPPSLCLPFPSSCSPHGTHVARTQVFRNIC